MVAADVPATATPPAPSAAGEMVAMNNGKLHTSEDSMAVTLYVHIQG